MDLWTELLGDKLEGGQATFLDKAQRWEQQHLSARVQSKAQKRELNGGGFEVKQTDEKMTKLSFFLTSMPLLAGCGAESVAEGGL